MDTLLILDNIKQYAPAYSLLAAVLVAYISSAIHRADEKKEGKLQHKKIIVPGVLSLVIVAAMAAASFFPLKETTWQIILVWGGSSIYYNVFMKKKKNE